MRVWNVAVVASTAATLIAGSVVMAPAALAVDEDPAIVSVDARPEPVGLWKTNSSQVSVDVVITDDVAVNEVKVGDTSFGWTLLRRRPDLSVERTVLCDGHAKPVGNGRNLSAP